MKNLYNIITLSIFFVLQMKCLQSQSLFLIMANDDLPFKSYAFDQENWKDYFYYKKIYKLEKNQLLLIDTINAFDNQLINQLIHFPEQKLFYIAEKDFTIRTPFNYSFSFLDYSENKLVIRRYYSGWDTLWANNYYWWGYSFLRNDRLIVQNIADLKNRPPNGDNIDFGYDKYCNKYSIESSDIYNLYLPGWSSFKDKLYYIFTFPQGNFTKLKIPWSRIYERMPDAPWQLPDSLKNENELYLYAFLNNDKYLALNFPLKEYTSNKTTKFYLLDKINNSWDTIRLPGIAFCNYKNWFYGLEKMQDTCDFEIIVSELCEKRKWEEKQKLEKKYNLHNGHPISFLDYPGNLFLYHVPTKKLIKWQAKDRDSEIIQIIDGIIYYRVFDELRKVRLDEKILNIDWSTDELIVKNRDIIPYVHHIFFSNTTQTKCEEVWVNKPKKCK